MSWIIFWRQSYLFPWGKIRDYLFGKHLIFCIGLLAIFSTVTYFVSVKWDLVHSVICSFGFTWFLFSMMISFIIICIFGFQLFRFFILISFLRKSNTFGITGVSRGIFLFKHYFFCLTSAEQVSAQFHKCGQRIKNTFFVSCRIDFNSSIFGNDAILAALLICCVKGEEKWIWRCVDWCCLLYWWRCGRVTLSEAHISFFVGERARVEQKKSDINHRLMVFCHGITIV